MSTFLLICWITAKTVHSVPLLERLSLLNAVRNPKKFCLFELTIELVLLILYSNNTGSIKKTGRKELLVKTAIHKNSKIAMHKT